MDLGSCTLTLASLLDVGPIPAKPAIERGKGTERVVAKWRDIGRSVASLGTVCVLEAGGVGWMAFGEYLVRPFARGEFCLLEFGDLFGGSGGEVGRDVGKEEGKGRGGDWYGEESYAD